MKIKELLKAKGPEVFTIGSEKNLYDAMRTMVNNHIGVLLVLSSEGRIEGIISERDIIRTGFNNPEGFLSETVNSVMTKSVIIVEPDDDIEYAEHIMTQNRIRHLPVVHNKVLVGLISVGDVIKAILTDTRHDNKYLLEYISGGTK